MEENPGESEISVFRKFVAEFMTLNNQLESSYNTDQFHGDRIITAINVPSIQSKMRDLMPRNSRQAVNRIANQLSEKYRTAGSNSVCISVHSR